jgi:hypothetical protein
LTLEELVAQANEQFEQAQAYAREGDWAGYGEEIAALEETLARLAELTGVELEPVPALDTTPTITTTEDNAGSVQEESLQEESVQEESEDSTP